MATAYYMGKDVTFFCFTTYQFLSSYALSGFFFFFSSQKKEHGKYKKILEIFPYSKIWKEDFWGNEKILKWEDFQN